MIKSKLYSAKVTRDAVDLVTAIMVSFKKCFQSKDIYIEAFFESFHKWMKRSTKLKAAGFKY